MFATRETIHEQQQEFRRLLNEYPHMGDPCQYCGVPHDDVSAGPCIPHLVSKNDGSIDDAMKSFSAKETVVREALAKINEAVFDLCKGVEGVFCMMTPAQRAMIDDHSDKVFGGIKMIEGALL